MLNNSSKNILNFYFEANKNKELEIDEHLDRNYSVAERTIMLCLNELLIDEECDDKIRYLFLSSLGGSLSYLTKKEEYKSFLNSYIFIPNNIKDKETYNNYLSLRKKIRQGHIYWGASGKRLESILEHIYGCIALIIGIESEFGYKLDYDKIIKMLLLHETEEIIIGDLTEWDISKEEKEVIGKNAVKKLLNQRKKLIDLIDEFNAKSTIESKYANLCDKLEYDMQVKVYELEGRYDFNNYPNNVVTQSDRVKTIIDAGAKSVFDVHYEYDKSRYSDVPCMKMILEETKKL